jgi:hypothetical protein
MKVTKIRVVAARTVPDPFHNYGNLRPEIALEAEIDDGESFAQCVEDLQATAEGLLNDHIEHLIVARTAIEDNDRLTAAQKRVVNLAGVIREDQKTLKKQREPIIRRLRKEGL